MMIWANADQFIFRALIEQYQIASVHNTAVHWERYATQRGADARPQSARWRAEGHH